MIVEKEVTVPATLSAVNERIKTYFKRKGYRQIIEKPLLKYRRGEGSGAFRAFSPDYWMAEVSINLVSQDNQVKITTKFDINTRGRPTLPWESRFWEEEVSEYEATLRNEKTDYYIADLLTRDALFANIFLLVFLIVVGGGIIVAILIGSGNLLSVLFGISQWVGITVAVVVLLIILFIFARIWQSRQKYKPGKKASGKR